MVIGLTVVSIGTSLPELAIGIDAARSGSPALAVGNIVGTNLVNLLFILGLRALRSGPPARSSELGRSGQRHGPRRACGSGSVTSRAWCS